MSFFFAFKPRLAAGFGGGHPLCTRQELGATALVRQFGSSRVAAKVLEFRDKQCAEHGIIDISRSLPAMVEHRQRAAVEIFCGYTGEGIGGQMRDGR